MSYFKQFSSHQHSKSGITHFSYFSFDTPIVTVVVGPESKRKTYFVRASLLCARSDFFESALRHSWKESTTKHVELFEEEPGTFESWLQNVYGQQTETKIQEIWMSEDDNEEIRRHLTDEYTRLFGAYMLGTRLQDCLYVDMIMDCVIKVVDQTAWTPEPGIFTKAFAEHLQAIKPFREFIVDPFVHFIKPFRPYSDVVERELATEIIEKFIEVTENGISPDCGNVPWKQGTCRYHQHTLTRSRCYKDNFSRRNPS